ncbi:uncharacterized protein LOC108677726 isoform X2 [Hyalella azteca]|uniref:Uncharacterized protein LOC108677726 isoform X2 n=1 Tax=Hyalella azteca TaxID=294128 RepID=A0A979FR71_HYAAZ|nr:uncharacterized protein LOC108677726 isoform X2 [Hyalella azteca]
MTAFAFSGICTAYQFNRQHCSCLGGEKVIYVANSSISYGPPATVVPFRTAPYINTTVENIEFKQYQLVNFFSDVFSTVMKSFDGEYGGYNAAHFVYLDVAFCVTDSPCGMPVLVNTTSPTYYILNECGNTIQLSPLNDGLLYSYSHPGFGCKAFPDGPTYNCSVTFTTANTRSFFYYGYFSGADGSCDGYTLGLEATWADTSKNVDLCSTAKLSEPFNSVTITLRGTAAAKTFKAGFSIYMY